MKKVLIVGSKGMAGHVIYLHLKSLGQYIVEDISRDDRYFPSTYHTDVTDTGNMESILMQSKPDYIINCVGVLNQDAEQNPDKSIFLNSFFPHFLARQATQIGAGLIHISTDCVFNGKRGAYTETDTKDGIGFYAQSKALGEVTYGNHITIRTSIIGPELKRTGIGLFDWFMKQHGTIKGYTQAWWTGVTTIELAKAIPDVMEQQVTGLIHLVNDGKINKYDLLGLFKTVFERSDINLDAFDGYAVDKSLLNTRKALDYTVPGYEQMVINMQSWIKEHSALYPDYLKASNEQ